MDIFLVAMVAAFAAWSFKSRAERQRIALLAIHLRQFDIEKLMETLSEGYMRALGEDDPQRRQAIWALLEPSERRLAEQFRQFAGLFGQVGDDSARIIRLGWPWSAAVTQLGKAFPGLVQRYGIDMRQLLNLHAQAIGAAASATGQAPSAKAFTLLAEMLLMQHSCHWFCKSKPLASARLLMRHQTTYEKVLASVAPATRRDYLALTQG